MENLKELINHLRSYSNETQWLEFKHNNYEPHMIGKDISALANSAAILERKCGYMIWGIDDETHEILGTTDNLQTKKVKGQELESWLRMMLSKNADFEFHTVELDNKTVGLMIVQRAMNQPVTFEKAEYIRIGSYTKPLNDHPSIKAQLWDRLRNIRFEEQYAKIDLSLTTALQLLDYSSYFDIKNTSMPTDEKGIAYYMEQEHVISKQDNGKFAITNLGAIALAKRLSDFDRITRKAIRIVQYEGLNKFNLLKDETVNKGYAMGIKESLKYLEALLPSKEEIVGASRKTKTLYPILAIREILANALIHQDFSVTGAGPTIEIFDNRIEITNPGRMLIDMYRIIDNPPKSRNEKLATLMRYLKLCEELGTGWDKIAIECERMQLPAPKIIEYEDSTKIIMYSKIPYANLSKEDRLWSCYLHACIRHSQGDFLTNSSLRERFGITDSNTSSVSRLIKEAINIKLIKPFGQESAPRYMKYLPFYA